MPWTSKIVSVSSDIKIGIDKGKEGGRKRVAIICPKHGFKREGECGECAEEASKERVYINTGECYRGWHEHIDTEPIFIESKEHLIRECEKRGKYAKCLMKPKSQGKGYEHARR